MTTDWIFGWWNLVFLAPFLLALIYLGVYAASGVTFGDGEAEAEWEAGGDVDHDVSADMDADHDLSADADHDFDADADADADHDVDSDHDADGEGEGSGHGSLFTALTWLGVGKVPLSIILMVLLMTWGSIGFATNVLARDLFGHPGQLLGLSLPLALIGSLLITGGISKAIVRFIPLNETSARRRHELLGCVGEAIFSIDQVSGVVSVRDEHGDLFQVSCRTRADAADAIPKASRVKLVAYDAPRKLFIGVVQPQQNNPPAASASSAVAGKQER